ncbi:hypothetical protein M5K25_010841 [Dendrobium thyrsiflorum]|uniref:Uncharacterized protein n=1 Tax=Dendrobium thyrsiflorum TaxID=117978 RepID=A0ABD0V182_DENTH
MGNLGNDRESEQDFDDIRADGGGSDDEPDQDPMVPSSRDIVIPGLLSHRRLPFLIQREFTENFGNLPVSPPLGFDAIGEHTGAGHNHNLVIPFDCESPGSEGPEKGIRAFMKRSLNSGRMNEHTTVRSNLLYDLNSSSRLFNFLQCRLSYNKMEAIFEFTRLPFMPFHLTVGFQFSTGDERSWRCSRLWGRIGLVRDLKSRCTCLKEAQSFKYPFLAVGTAPISHPTALEKSAYRRSASPSRTPKKRLLDHLLGHKHRDALSPTTSRRRVCRGKGDGVGAQIEAR